MWKKIWRNRLEFYPYMSILFFWFFGSFVQSLKVTSQSGITTLGLITVFPVGLIVIAVVKTYKALPETGTVPGPDENN